MSKGNQSVRPAQGGAAPALSTENKSETIQSRWVTKVLVIGQLQASEIQRMLDIHAEWEPFAATSTYLFLKRKV